MLHSAIYWPKDGKVSDILKSIEKYADNFISLGDLYMIFDRYYEKSIKSDTRMKRLEGFKRTHHLTGFPISGFRVGGQGSGIEII